jgi:hypothetical protein
MTGPKERLVYLLLSLNLTEHLLKSVSVHLTVENPLQRGLTAHLVNVSSLNHPVLMVSRSGALISLLSLGVNRWVIFDYRVS